MFDRRVLLFLVLGIGRALASDLPAPEKREIAPERISRPFEIGYAYRQYRATPEPTTYAIRAMHVLHGILYPFGGADTPFALRAEASWFQAAHGVKTGPLALAGRLRLFSVEGFEFGVWASAALTTVSADELKNSPYGRDVYRVGVVVARENRIGYVESFFGVTGGGQAEQNSANARTTYVYGDVFDVKVRGGAKLWKVHAGGFLELHLASGFKVSGAVSPYDASRFRIFSGGPEISFRTDDMQFAVQGRWLLVTTPDATFDYLGNLMGVGVAQGGMAGTVSVFF